MRYIGAEGSSILISIHADSLGLSLREHEEGVLKSATLAECMLTRLNTTESECDR